LSGAATKAPPSGTTRLFEFNRPAQLRANEPPEWRGLERDAVRLLVSDDEGHQHARFTDLAHHLAPGDLLVVNESATLPASLPARGRLGEFRLNLSTRYDALLWLAEPRWSSERPGPMPLRPGDRFVAAGLPGRFVARYAGTDRLWFVAFAGNVGDAMKHDGDPIRYGYLREPLPPLSMYQTIFARTPGSAEMPSAGRPFTRRVLQQLKRRGVHVVGVLLHTGVSSLEVEPESGMRGVTYPEPFRVSPVAAAAVNRARDEGGRVIAVGTTVVRALESAVLAGRVRATQGYTNLIVEPRRGAHVVDGLITGLHDPRTTHLALLSAVGGIERVRAAYEEAVREAYLWHEFGDTHLLWKPGKSPINAAGR
jgi:S-adenosylmethionine:tRNA ribosyltransferase-isomerase